MRADVQFVALTRFSPGGSRRVRGVTPEAELLCVLLHQKRLVAVFLVGEEREFPVGFIGPILRCQRKQLLVLLLNDVLWWRNVLAH